jgi:DNA-3-methyladenine glycosylase II
MCRVPKVTAIADAPVGSWPTRSVRLTPAIFSRGLDELAKRDRDLANVIAAIGAPPLWARQPGFGTLLHIILEQQVSLASAQAAYDKLLALGRPLTPERFLTYADAELHTAGFSRQKARYGRELAMALHTGSLKLHGFSRLDDDKVRAALVNIKGIGPWTAEIYLLMVLRRADAWPVGDLALALAAQSVKNLASVPRPTDLELLGAIWRPWRAVAARILWHQYLTQRRRIAPVSAPIGPA